jgi:magnesium chelatase subunit D
VKSPGYPFAAIVGQPDLKLALLLASIDWRLSVLLKGDKGSGKSTAARALADILPAGAPFVNLPIGTTEDRLLGGLDLAQALEGQANLKRGLIHQAHGGVLYIDEVNLLSDSLADALLDVASSGQHYVERDGFSASGEARFILLGSMNIEEGILRPQLLDRFALSLDVQTPQTAEDRALIVESRLQFDADPEVFCREFAAEQERFRQAIIEARSRVVTIKPQGETLQEISQAVVDAGVHSLRADLATLRAAMAHAALAGHVEVLADDIEAVLPLVLHHRIKPHSDPPSRPPQTQPSSSDSPRESAPGQNEAKDRVFPPDTRHAPELRLALADSIARGRSATVRDRTTAESVRTGGATQGESLDVMGSFTRSFRNTGSARLQPDHLVFRRSHSTSGVRFIFVVDASGSQAAHQRMRAVKGVAVALLESSVDHKDEVAVVSFRGASAEVALDPCRDASAAQRALEFLPTGGRTPLAHALELANTLVNSASLLILLTDGRANVPLANGDPWADAVAAAMKVRCASVVVDSSIDGSRRSLMEELASAMQARLIHLDELGNEVLMQTLKR